MRRPPNSHNWPHAKWGVVVRPVGPGWGSSACVHGQFADKDRLAFTPRLRSGPRVPPRPRASGSPAPWRGEEDPVPVRNSISLPRPNLPHHLHRWSGRVSAQRQCLTLACPVILVIGLWTFLRARLVGSATIAFEKPAFRHQLLSCSGRLFATSVPVRPDVVGLAVTRLGRLTVSLAITLLACTAKASGSTSTSGGGPGRTASAARSLTPRLTT